jgi:hypothetical protein
MHPIPGIRERRRNRLRHNCEIPPLQIGNLRHKVGQAFSLPELSSTACYRGGVTRPRSFLNGDM